MIDHPRTMTDVECPSSVRNKTKIKKESNHNLQVDQFQMIWKMKIMKRISIIIRKSVFKITKIVVTTTIKQYTIKPTIELT